MQVHKLSDLEKEYVGEVGTEERDQYEYELRMELLSRMIRITRKQKKLTQQQLGELIGDNKLQISKLENHLNSARIETIIKVFKALQAEIQFSVVLDNQQVKLA